VHAGHELLAVRNAFLVLALCLEDVLGLADQPRKLVGFYLGSFENFILVLLLVVI